MSLILAVVFALVLILIVIGVGSGRERALEPRDLESRARNPSVGLVGRLFG